MYCNREFRMCSRCWLMNAYNFKSLPSFLSFKALWVPEKFFKKMFTHFNDENTRYFSHTVHYCSSCSACLFKAPLPKSPVCSNWLTPTGLSRHPLLCLCLSSAGVFTTTAALGGWRWQLYSCDITTSTGVLTARLKPQSLNTSCVFLCGLSVLIFSQYF